MLGLSARRRPRRAGAAAAAGPPGEAHHRPAPRRPLCGRHEPPPGHLCPGGAPPAPSMCPPSGRRLCWHMHPFYSSGHCLILAITVGQAARCKAPKSIVEGDLCMETDMCAHVRAAGRVGGGGRARAAAARARDAGERAPGRAGAAAGHAGAHTARGAGAAAGRAGGVMNLCCVCVYACLCG